MYNTLSRAAAGTWVIYYPGNFLLPDTTRVPELEKNHGVCPCKFCSTKTRTFSFNNRPYLFSSVEFVSNRKMTIPM